VQFNNQTSLKDCNYFVWKFGDGDTLVTNDPYGTVNHTYKSYGNYTPVMKAYFQNAQKTLVYKGEYQSITFYINGQNLYVKDSICPNEMLSLNFYNGQTGNVFFDFGNGKTAIQNAYSSLTTSYPIPGTYYIKTIFKNTNCNNTIDTLLNKIIVSKLLKANSDFNLSKTVFCPNEPFNLNASSSSNVSYTWDMGDKTTYTGNNINHAYKDEWDNVIKLTTKNACGNISTNSKTVKVSKSASKYFKSYVNIYSNKNQACVGEPINFNSSSDFSYKSIVWNFKDNTLNTSENYTNHSFKYTGTYLVQAKLTNHCDIDTIVNLPITIKDVKMPFKNIPSLANKNVCPGEKVSYWVDNYNNQIKNYSWILPNNVVISNKSFDRTFNEGENIIYLRMSNYCGNDTMISAKINVNKNQPISKNISFQQNQLEFCPNEEFDIRYNSSGIKTFTWVDVSPISQDNGYSGTFKFPTSGDRLLKLKLTSYCGKDTTISTTIKIVNKKPINVSFYDYYFNKSYCPGNEVYFSLNGDYESSSYKSKEYDYGDGITGSSSSHIYKNYGNYLVKLKLTNFCNNDTTIQNTIKIERSSINKAIFISSNNNETEFCQGDKVDLNISQNNNYQDFKNVVWDFGDGEKLTSDTYVNHAFKKSGLLTVKATVTSFCDDTLTVFKQLNIRNDIAYKGYIDDEITDEVCPGERADFYVNGNFKSVTWDFGDNTPLSNQKNTTHIYENAGYYTVTLKVKNQCGIETILQKSVEVSKDVYPDLDIDELIDYACPGEKLPFFVGTSSKDNTLTFDFGDNNKDFNVIHDFGISNYKIIAHKFTTPGTYNVTLKAVNKCGNSDSESETIVVKEGVKLDPNSDIEDIFNNDDFGPNLGDTIAFLLESNGLEFTWDFGNNEIKKTDVGFIKHKFSSPGIKTVNVNVKTACGETMNYTTTVNAEIGSTVATINKIETQVLQVYPNPSNGNFTISGAPIGNYKIYNELGIAVNQFEINDLGNHTVNLKNNVNGIYFIVGEDNNIRQKISVLE
jgi:PKD repeat protein